MRLSRLSTIAAAMTLIAGAGLLMPSTPSVARQDSAMGDTGESFVVDSMHSMIMFRIKHMGIAYTYGRFNDPTGTYNIDPNDPAACFIDMEVKADNVDTANKRRDDHLRSPDFFNVKQYPTISFKADDFKKTGDNTLSATGTLSMHGESRPVEVNIEFHGEGKTMQGYKSGFEAEFTVKRTDFGMDTYVEEGALGDEVNLYVTVEGKQG